MKIRVAGIEDLKPLLELYRSLEGPYSGVTKLGEVAAKERFLEVLNDSRQRTLIAEVDGEPVGTLVVAIIPNLAHGGAPYAVVDNVVVEERSRGMGIGKALVKEAMGRAREAGAYKLSLTANLSRERAHEFYRGLGFAKTHLGFEVAL